MPILLSSQAMAKRSVAYYNSPHGVELAKSEETIRVTSQMVQARRLMGTNPLVIDVGCGLGRGYYALKELELRYIGVDAALEQIRLAKERHPEGDFRVGDFYKLAEAVAEKCDGFYALHSLLHVPRDFMARALSGIRTTQRVGAIGYIEVPHGESSRTFTKGVSTPSGTPVPKDMFVLVTSWSIRLLRPLLAETGFAVIEEATAVSDDYLKLTVRTV